MSFALRWRPVSPGIGTLPEPLRWAMEKQFGYTELLSGVKLTWHDSWLSGFLVGLRAANVEGADDLIEILRKHKEIELWLER